MAALRDNHPPDTSDRGVSTLADEALVRLAQADPSYFGALYDRYAAEITRFYLARVEGNDAIAQDLTSQVFTRACVALPRYSEGSFRGWLYQIARNLLIDRYRRHRPATPLEGIMSLRAADPPLDEQVIAAEARAQLHSALDTLGEPGRSILTLRLRGLTGPEIAAELGLSHEAMKSAQ